MNPYRIKLVTSTSNSFLKRWVAKFFLKKIDGFMDSPFYTTNYRFVRRWLGGHWEWVCFRFPDGWAWERVDRCNNRSHLPSDGIIRIGPGACEDYG